MKTSSKIIFTVLLILATNYSFAPPPPPGGGTNPACWPVCVPIDNGLIFLMVATALYGTKKLFDYQRKKVAV
ncbi:MAG: hypothetical protein ACYDCN_03735 [Bacteroidia bacterium]